MQTTDSKTESKRKRRRGSYAEELAKQCNITVYKAKRCLKFHRLIDEIAMANPEIADQVQAINNFVISGRLKFRQAIPLVEMLREAPEVIPLVVSDKLKLDDCLEAIRQGLKEGDDALSFEEKVEQSFERWLSKWPKDKRREIYRIIDDFSYNDEEL